MNKELDEALYDEDLIGRAIERQVQAGRIDEFTQSDGAHEAQLPKPVVRITRDDRTLRPLAEIEAEILELAIKWCYGNRTEAARQLGISRATVFAKTRPAANITTEAT